MTPSDPHRPSASLDPVPGGNAGGAASGPASDPPLPADPDERGAGAERRLHPLSWLFVLLTTLRHAVFPLIVLVFLGGRDDEAWGLGFAAVGAVLLAIHSVFYALAFRYRIGATELIVREGIFDRTERHVPFVRIQNVSQRRNPLHRLFGVSELRVESAGGTEPEARMSVVTVADAAMIERLLKERRAAASGAQGGMPAEGDAAEPLLALPLGEVIRLGLVSNRGMVVVAAMMGALLQFRGDPRDVGVLRTVWSFVERLIGDRLGGTGPVDLVVSGAILLLLAFAALRVLSVAVAILRHYGFVLELTAGRAGTEEGLLTRMRAGAAVDRIQRLVVEESLPMRWLGRRSARVDVAGGIAAVNEAPGSRFRWIAPIARPEVIDAIIARLLPRLDPGRADWRPLHPRAWRRLVVAPSMLLVGLGLVGVLVAAGPLSRTFLGHWPWPVVAVAWPVALLLVWCHAFGWARFSRYALDAHTLAFREGWLSRRWTAIESARIQGVVVRASPLDRWNGMATLVVDVAGTAPTEHGIEIPFLPAEEAWSLAATLRRRLVSGGDAPAASASEDVAGTA
jgi:putative membrane protein